MVIGDLASIAQTREVAEQVNKLGTFDAVIHNAGIGLPRVAAHCDRGWLVAFVCGEYSCAIHSYGAHQEAEAAGLPEFWLAPERRCQLAGSHLGASPWRGQQAYSDTKLHDVLWRLRWRATGPTFSPMRLEPGWVATKMGGAGATDDLDAGHRTQVWLAVSDDPAAMVTGEYFYHMQASRTKAGHT